WPGWRLATYAGQETANFSILIRSAPNLPSIGSAFAKKFRKKWSAWKTCIEPGVPLDLGLDWDLTTRYSPPERLAVKRCMCSSGRGRRWNHVARVPTPVA